MSLKSEKLNEKIVPLIMKFVNLKGIQALKDGILFILPLTMIGSIFLLLANIPIPAFNSWMASIFGEGWTAPLMQAFAATFNIIALVSVVGIAYIYAKNDGHEPLSAGVIALVVYILTMNTTTTSSTGEVVTGVIPMGWTGGKGMVTAIIIGLIVGAIYSFLMKKDITIKMPAGVPQGVADSFAALIPAAIIVIGATIVWGIFKYALNTTFIEWIYKVLQIPLQNVTDSYGGVLVISFIIPFFWWFGIHGATIVGGVMTGILTANTAANQAIVDSGKALTIENGARIVTQQFLDNMINLTGSGVTIGLVLCMLFVSKSAQYKQLGKLAALPACFNINEPITFGTPIVVNPFMAIPFIFTPMLVSTITYFAIYTGLVPPFSGVMAPWTTPPIISGFIIGGWRMALLQVVIIGLSVLMYFPFFKKMDRINYKAEQAAQLEGVEK